MTDHAAIHSPGRAGRAREDAAVRRILEAAAAAPDELPSPSPFLMAQLRAHIAAAATPPPVTVGSLAWQTLPALLVVVLALSGWAGLETARADASREESVARLLAGEQAGGDAVLATLVLGGGAQ